MTARRGQIKLAIDKNIPKDIDLSTLEMSEFPNGGARVVARSLQQVNRQNLAADSQSQGPAGSPLQQAASIPVLMDSVQLSQSAASTELIDDAMGEDLYDDEGEAFHVAETFSADMPGVEPDMDAIVEANTASHQHQEEGADEADIQTHFIAIDPDFDSVVDGDDCVDSGNTDDDWLMDTSNVAATPEIDVVTDDIEEEIESEINTEQGMEEIAEQAMAETVDGFDLENHQQPILSGQDEFQAQEHSDNAESGITLDQDSASAPAFDGFAERDLVSDQEQQPPSQESNSDVYSYNLQQHDNPQRREPALTIDEGLLDEFSEFSMTAGERIGEAKPLANQGELFSGEAEPEERDLAPAPKKKSFFANLANKVRPEKEGELYGSAGEYEEFPEDIYEEGDLLEPLVEDQLDDEMQGATFDDASAEDDHVSPTTEDRLDQTMELLEETVSDMEQRGGQEPSLSIELADAEDLDTINVVEDETVTAMSPRPEPKPEPAPTIDEPSEVVVLNVMSRQGREFHGNDLLQVLITSGLKFGEMNIFHKRLDNSNHGPVLFSVANMINPGTFDLNTMEDFRTRGVTLFLTLPSALNNLEALDLMLETAQQIRGALDGELRDDSRNVMTAQTIEHYRQRVRDFELSLLKTASRH